MKTSPTFIARNELVFIRYQEVGTPTMVDNVAAPVNCKKTVALFASLVSSCPDQGKETGMENFLYLLFSGVTSEKTAYNADLITAPPPPRRTNKFPAQIHLTSKML
jgi:hypothetical protein